MNSRALSPIIMLTILAFLTSCTAKADVVPTTSTPTTYTDSPVVSTTLADTPAATSSSTPTSSTKKPITSTQKTPVASSASSTKTKSITYATPEGSATAAFSLSVQDGTISAASASMVSGDRESRQYISRFASSISRSVVGKKVSEVSLDTVGGASLTTEAFTRFLTSTL